jgi:hypothetical protein
LYHAWVAAAGGKIDAQLRVARAAAALEGRGKRLLEGLRASGVAAGLYKLNSVVTHSLKAPPDSNP